MSRKSESGSLGLGNHKTTKSDIRAVHIHRATCWLPEVSSRCPVVSYRHGVDCTHPGYNVYHVERQGRHSSKTRHSSYGWRERTLTVSRFITTTMQEARFNQCQTFYWGFSLSKIVFCSQLCKYILILYKKVTIWNISSLYLKGTARAYVVVKIKRGMFSISSYELDPLTPATTQPQSLQATLSHLSPF